MKTLDVRLVAFGKPGSGKTIILNLIKETLEAKGCTVKSFEDEHELHINGPIKLK